MRVYRGVRKGGGFRGLNTPLSSDKMEIKVKILVEIMKYIFTSKLKIYFFLLTKIFLNIPV